MHTQEQRAKAVMLFIESGFDYAAVKSALGYPLSRSLGRWYEDYFAKGCVKERRERWEKFTDEEKAEAVEACIANGGNILKTVQELGYPSRPLLAKWVDEAFPDLRKKDKPHVKHSRDEKVAVVIGAYSDAGSTVSSAIAAAGINETTFYNWRKEILGDDAQKVVDGLNGDGLPDDVGELQAWR